MTKLRPYELRIDGPALRKQWRALLEIRRWKLADEMLNALDGLIELVDEVADQAYCKHGIRGLNDRYKDEEDRRCECERPGYTYSGVPGILAHMKYGRLAKGAEVARCDACERYPSDETALKKLRELGLV